MPARNRRLNGGPAPIFPSSALSKRSETPLGAARQQAVARPFPPMLDPEASAALRDQLAAELKAIGSAEEAATWAHRVIGCQGQLVAADAKRIESGIPTRGWRNFESAAGIGPRQSSQRAQAASIGSTDRHLPRDR